MRQRKRRRGQSMVEFALILPLLLTLVFGLMDFAYIIYSWSQVQFAARLGAEQASKLPPRDVLGSYNNAYIAGDPCYREILNEIGRNGAFSNATAVKTSEVYISFWAQDSPSGNSYAARFDPETRFTRRTSDNRNRRIMNVIEVRIEHAIEPLTPVGDVIFGGPMTLVTASRRTIVSTVLPAQLASDPDLATCRDT